MSEETEESIQKKEKSTRDYCTNEFSKVADATCEFMKAVFPHSFRLAQKVKRANKNINNIKNK